MYTVKMSDEDILVVTCGINNKKEEMVLGNVEDLFFSGKDIDRDINVLFINGDIKNFNKSIEEDGYFYTPGKKKKSLFTVTENTNLPVKENSPYTKLKSRRRSILMKSLIQKMNFHKLQNSFMRICKTTNLVFSTPIKTVKIIITLSA